ncbi:histone deacetylase family protein [Chondromyces apiculatus]|uniref:Histone deacetylase family protein n=1 Tax=Chondromyces apiculatus DSM 436 TaxID=1192034 RepID=A0A017T2N1_9BACT|nr:histone deacetylase [Chondromyces apiculatus]EYF03070.1 histone deacetylase family protein [Chondromyces apiculatus DSM 436]
MHTLLVSSSRLLEHDPGPEHPESPSRLRSVLAALTNLPEGAVLRDPGRMATAEELGRVHTGAYLEAVLGQRGRACALDEETILSEGSVEAALLAAGACLALVDALCDGSARNGFALVRPPGHHATAARAMGYCIFNNVAAAAAHAIVRGVKRVLVVDWDVHHGNGTQEIFEARDDVLFFSVHQERLFPGGGGVDERGTGPGAGLTRNVPLAPGADDEVYAAVLTRELAPLVAGFEPEMVLVSAGFDAHADDPMSEQQVSTAGFAALCDTVCALAQRSAGGRVGLVLEGGYDLASLGASVRACVEVLCRRSREGQGTRTVTASHAHE